MKPRKPGSGFTGRWNHERFLGMLRARGIDTMSTGASVVIASRITCQRRAADPEADAVDPRTARRWLSGEQDPSKGAGGRDPYIWEICLVFDVDPAWLMTGEAQP